MNEKEKNDLFYVCSLIEFLGRKTKNHRSDIVKLLGIKELNRQLDLAEVNHCISFDEVADELIDYYNIKDGEFDSVKLCKYTIPTYLSIGKEYQRLILDVIKEGEDVISVLYDVFTSFISDEISNFNSSVYYSSPQYLKYSYLEGKLLP
ncbi:hypothetical protein [uncultured Clostridium sp.]|uniref:hypothetical protein n=1 Tax=uncultured Clostridium sp. TaxID=59620 RepID=UPI0025FCFA19|nr:hypothetical protein [uncultured Clostridium sp.]